VSENNDFDIYIGEYLKLPTRRTIEEFAAYSRQELESCMDTIHASYKVFGGKENLLSLFMVHEMTLYYEWHLYKEMTGENLTYDHFMDQYVVKNQPPKKLLITFLPEENYAEIEWTKDRVRLFFKLRALLGKQNSIDFDEALHYSKMQIDAWWKYTSSLGSLLITNRRDSCLEKWRKAEIRLSNLIDNLEDNFHHLYKHSFVDQGWCESLRTKDRCSYCEEEWCKWHKKYEIADYQKFVRECGKSYKEKAEYAKNRTGNLMGYRDYIKQFFPHMAEEADAYIQEGVS
jgi:hypothetical protein